MLSKGFPNIVVFRIVHISLILMSMISFCIQVAYLASTPFSVEQDLMFLINMFLVGTKVILIIMEFGYKNSKLGEAPTALAKREGLSDHIPSSVELGCANKNKGLVYQHNPMQKSAEDTVPLLQRMDNVEHETKGIKEKTKSIEVDIKTKTDRIEERIKLALEEMNAKIEKVTNKLALEEMNAKIENVEYPM